jgi:hypothetical protein
LRQFSAAVQQRLGDDTVRAMVCSGGGSVEAPSVPRQHHAALAAIRRTEDVVDQQQLAAAADAPGDRSLTIAEAKRGLATMFDVSPEAIEIVVRS